MNSASSSSDILKIREWLAEVFDGEEVPPFDESEEAIEALRKIMAKNLEAEKNTREIIKQEQQLTQKYNEASVELKSRLDCGINLSVKSLETINCLAHFAKDLSLKEPTLTNFVLAMQEAENKKMEIKKEMKTVQYHLATLNRKTASTIKKNQILKRDLKDLKKTVEVLECRDTSMNAHLSFFKKKVEEYKIKIQNIVDILKNDGCEPVLYHHNLVKESKKIIEMEEQLKSLVSHVKAYESLPPNEELARLKVHELQQEVQTLEKDFNKLVDLWSDP